MISYKDNVFINCPFDKSYKPLFQAVVFAIHHCGLIARCSLEVSDSAEFRLRKIMRLISECKYAVHDISKTTLDSKNRLPRFNMPLELGIFLGCKQFGDGIHKKKVCLIMDKEKYRYQKFISDIAGQDIVAHGNSTDKAIAEIRNWLSSETRQLLIPGGAKVSERYSLFQKQLPKILKGLHIRTDELTFIDFSNIVTEWLNENPLS